MRGRHSITILPESIQPDVPIRPEGSGPGLRTEDRPEREHVEWLDGVDDSDVLDLDEPELIDESIPERPFLPQGLSETAAPDRPSSRQSRPMAPATTGPPPRLPWGAGTNGWPRYRSRLVRLFACDHAEFIAQVSDRSWGPLVLGTAAPSEAGDASVLVSSGTLQMPYASPPLLVELQAQPFHGRYTRVDVIMLSPRRRPRRFFDVASQCLTLMHCLERPARAATHVTH